jgi:hypothetical protein
LERLAAKHPLAAMCCDKVYAAADTELIEEFESGIWPHPQTNNANPTKNDWVWNVKPDDLNILLDNFDEFSKTLPPAMKDLLKKHQDVRERIYQTTPKELQASTFRGYCKIQSPRGTHLTNAKMCSLTAMREILETKDTSNNPTFWDAVGEMMDKNIMAKPGHLPQAGTKHSWKKIILAHNPGDR